MSTLSIYSIFHLNLAYSSLSKERRKDVIARCYWPLLRLAEDTDVGIGIEATVFTLEKIQEIDPLFIEKLKSLIQEKKCEFIGSGCAQVIGPIVPVEVNEHNLGIGNDLYESMLGIRPRIAYLNELTYSKSLVQLYIDAGYEAIYMESNNPVKFHPEWNFEIQYNPQVAVDDKGRKIKLLWNNSVGFQKFQRYASAEIDMNEYMEYLLSHVGEHPRFFSYYGSDAEIFDFRTVRYDEEAPIVDSGEWQRIRDLLTHMKENPNLSFMSPSRALGLANGQYSFNEIRLESGDQPIPVKKREKYNLTRWSLTGRDDIGINTMCYQIYSNLMQYQNEKKVSAETDSTVYAYWKDLCYLWGSDFRTHIVEDRFIEHGKKIRQLLDDTNKLLEEEKGNFVGNISIQEKDKTGVVPVVKKEGRKVIVETACVSIELNVQKGLAIESLVYKDISEKSLIGTLQNGYYNDVSFAEDFFSGHTAIAIPMRQKITDLEHVDILISEVSPDSEYVDLECDVRLKSGVIKKKIRIYNYANRIDIEYDFRLKDIFPSSFRTCVLTYNPNAFEKKSLYYGCHNGGEDKEYFDLKKDLRCGQLLFHLISAQSVLGNTKGSFEIGDKDKTIEIVTDMTKVAALPMIDFIGMKEDNYFLRTFYSLGEFDETSLLSNKMRDAEITFSATIFGKRNCRPEILS